MTNPAPPVDDARVFDDDAKLAKWLGIDGTKECAAILKTYTPEKRREEEEFAKVEAQIMLWDKGLGPLPPDVIACGRCGPHKTRKGHRHD